MRNRLSGVTATMPVVRFVDVTAVPAEAAALVSEHLAALDRELPDLVQGLYLTGSVALGDFKPGISDVDFVAVISRRIASAGHEAIAAIHRRLSQVSIPSYDGVYVERALLSRPPMNGEAAAHSLNGEYDPDGPCFQISPTTWLELHQHGLRLRGSEAAAELVEEPDPDVLKSWLLQNLQGYWSRLSIEIEGSVAEIADETPVEAESVIWGVLGPGRLHCTLATGRIISKTEAGRYTADHFPVWSRLAERCVRARAGEPEVFSASDARTCAQLIGSVVDDAAARWA
jgi:hypothetical protein